METGGIQVHSLQQLAYLKTLSHIVTFEVSLNKISKSTEVSQLI